MGIRKIFALAVILLAAPAMKEANGNDTSVAHLPAWYDESGLTEEGEKAITIIKLSESHGIDSSRYHLKNFEEAKIKQASDAGKLNNKLTQTLVTYLMDLKYGVIRTPAFVASIKPEEAEGYKSYYAASINNLIEHENYEDELAKLIGDKPEYWQLRQALVFFNAVKENDLIKKVTFTRSIKPGESDKSIPLIAHNLQIITSTESITDIFDIRADENYDDAVVELVKEFQAMNGITPDGVIGKQTVERMNSFVDLSMAQIKLTMERIRYEDKRGDGKFIVVNIPEFRLYAYDKGKKEFSMEIIVGRKDRETPEFGNHLEYISFNPEWHPTARIMNNDLMPKLRNNLNYIKKGGYVITWKDTNERISPEQYDMVDWTLVSSSQINIKQTSGAHNSLGRIKFSMPNSDSIYLHDTNTHSLFAAAYRALSSGCIRLSDPVKLAEFVLKDKDISAEKIKKKMNSGKNEYIKTAEIPVHSVYHTAWFDEGKFNVRADIYNKSAKFKLALAKGIKPEKLMAILPANPGTDGAGIEVDKVASIVAPRAP